MSTLKRAIAIATSAHAGQVDKAGRPYVEHPLRVMQQMTTPKAKCVAALHDVVEDSPWTLEQLRAEGFSAHVVDALDALTHRTDETYAAYILRVQQNPLARRVKCADLRDNSDISRIPHPTARDFARLERYQKAQRVLGCQPA